MHTTVKVQWLFTICAVALALSADWLAPFQRYAAVTLWAILLWMFELLPEAAVAMILPVLYVLFGVVPPEIAFKAWSSGTPWIALGGLVVGQAVIESGLVRRIACKALLLTGGSFAGIALALSATCLLMAPFIPSIMAKVALMLPLAVGICQTLRIEKKSAAASALFLTVFLALWSPKMAFLTASTDSVLTANLLAEVCGLPISWLGWARDMLLPSLLWTALSISLVCVLRPSVPRLDRAYLQAQYDALGPLRGKEKRTAALVALLLLALVTDSYHQIQANWLMLLAAAASFLPGVALADAKTLEKTPFAVILFLTAALTIGNAATATGAARQVVLAITPFFAGLSEYGFVMSLYGLGFLSIFILNPLALVGTLLGSLAKLCTALGYSPYLAGYAMIMGFNLAVFPYEVAPLMLLYGAGYIRLAHLLKVLLLRAAAGFVFTSLITYPYWQLMGVIR